MQISGFFPVLFIFLVAGVGGSAMEPKSKRQELSGHERTARKKMVQTQIRARGVRNEAVLEAMSRVPRHLFVPEAYARLAYDDSPLPIGKGQTISQPYIVAFMTEALELSPEDRVLEVGTGSGYQAAVLAELVREVYSIEIIPELGNNARERLEALGYKNIQVRVGDGYMGWPGKAPFDAIIVTAAADKIPPPLMEQLKEGGRLCIPVGSTNLVQSLLLLTKKRGGFDEKKLLPVRFVPLVRPE